MYKVKKYNDYNKIIWIHGLPGSGKSTLAEKISRENPSENYIILDDISDIKKLQIELEKGNNIILNSTYFENYHEYGKYGELKKLLSDYMLEEVWFENDPKSCIENIRGRKNHSIDSISILPEILYYSRSYEIPKGVKTIPVYKKS